MSEFLRRTFPHLVDLAYGASLEPARWQTFLDALSEPFGGASGVLCAFDSSRGYVDFHYNYGNDPDYFASYLQHYSHINPYGQPSSNLPVGQVCMASQSANIDHIRKTEFYNCWMKPQGIPVDHFGVVLHKDATKHVTFGLAPQASIFDRNRERYARELELIVPHHRSPDRDAPALGQWSVATDIPARRRKIHGVALGDARAKRARCGSGREPATVSPGAAGQPRGSTLVHSGRGHPARLRPVSRRGAALVAGQQAAAYASDLGLSRNTVRNHLAAAFAKTGTSRQSELVALVIGSLRWVRR